MRRSIPILSLILVGAAGGIAACNLALGLDDLKDQVDGGPVDSGAKDGARDARVDADVDVDAGPCPDYCASINTRCGSFYPQYLDSYSCLAMCATFPPGTTSVGANTLYCRLNALKAVENDAAAADASCGAAGPYSEHCGGEAANFCALYELACGDSGAYDYGADCPGTFGAIAPGDGGFILESTDDTRACREHFLAAAFKADGGGLYCMETSKASDKDFCGP